MDTTHIPKFRSETADMNPVRPTGFNFHGEFDGTYSLSYVVDQNFGRLLEVCETQSSMKCEFGTHHFLMRQQNGKLTFLPG